MNEACLFSGAVQSVDFVGYWHENGEHGKD
jgi:hypothetical protein